MFRFFEWIITEEMKIYNQKPAQIRLETSIWYDKVVKFETKDLVTISQNALDKEIKLFDIVCQIF